MKNWQTVNRFDQLPDLPILAEIDVLVIGGGAAGVAAACTAGNMGKNTWLIEKYGFCGGAAVAGLSGTICGMYMASDNPDAKPEQVVFGFTEKFRQALEDKGGVTGPQRYGKTFTVTHDPLMWREVADDMLEDAGVNVLFHTAVTGVIMEGDEFKGVVLESNAGQSIILAKQFIDASGDAAGIARAGFEYYFGDEGRIQNPTMFFRIAGVDLDQYLEYYGEDTICPPKVTENILAANASGDYDLPRHKIWIFPTTRDGELMVNATRLAGQDGRMLNVIDPVDFTEAEVFGRRQVRDYARFLNNFVPGCENAYVVDTGVEVGIRQTRSIVGVETLTNDDVVTCRKRQDGICRTPWPIELHSGDKPKLHWLLNDYYDVPFSALIPAVGENIIVAGRSLSAEHEALASARVTAQCFEYGHAAGVAVVKAIDENKRIRDLDSQAIRTVMIENGSAL
ncbi:FAD-dependent oxidoreductase [Photobacterium rosenbergii]|uniref:FAD-dependent oxidoreductase n=1 Tax=Photobacterium rosenbergii TaxID=294936 RepID=A0ABU3ZP40_9GAMM|nr:FAD-dependent oxidoreductase [Photobacterium rosenbergii]MDV5171872.1 FAD-dependent oxidoreductase [Photobacterium rosenbergii]